MANGSGRIESYYARGMLQIRPTLHLAYRLTIRAMQVLEPTGAAAEGAGAWRLALPVFVALDLAIWWVLRRSGRFGLAWRLPLDALDAAFWTMSPTPATGQAELAVLVATPLAVEGGVRMGWRAMAVPAVLLVSTALGGAAVGKPVQVSGVGWLTVGVTVGVAFLRYCGHLDGRAERDRRRHAAAAHRRAYLAGQNDVAMGASSAVDVMEGLVPLLGAPPPGSALRRLADGWKGDLSASTAQEARYLHVAVLEWQRAHNAHPDLSGLVDVEVPEGQGTTLLSDAQAQRLRHALDRLPIRGRVLLRLLDAGQPHLPGQQLRLDVGGHPVVVPADRRASPTSMDPAAVAYYYAALTAGAWLLPVAGSVEPRAAAAGVGLCVVAGYVSHREAVTRGRRARVGVFFGAVAVSLVLTWLNSFVRDPLRPDGVPALNVGTALIVLSFLGGYYWYSLGRWRWLLPAAVGANVAVGLLTHPVPALLTARTVAAFTLYGLFAFFPCRHLSRAMDAAAAEHAISVATIDAGAERAAFLEGRESVVGLVRQARADALRQLEVIRPGLDRTVADVAEHRLEEVGRRLAATAR